MPISAGLTNAILKALNISPATLSRRATRLARDHGPMSPDEARWVIAHEAGIDLRKHSLSRAQLDRVRELRPMTEAAQPETRRGRRSPSAQPAPASAPAGDAALTPAAVFKARSFHTLVTRSSRKLFVDGHPTEAVYRAFVRINNRVKKLTGISDDGQGLMSKAFGGSSPALRITGLTNESEVNEQKGTCLLMMGAMTGIRNPRVHEDKWEQDNDVAAVLDALSFASLLHRFLDRCEAYRQNNP